MRLSKAVIAGLTVGFLTCSGIVLLVPPFRWMVIKPHYPPGYEDLMDAIESTNPNRVQEVLARGVDPNRFPDSTEDMEREIDTAPLPYAVDQGNIEVVKLLLSHGANPNLGDTTNGTPLGIAVNYNRTDIMAILIKDGAKVNDQPQGSDYLWQAATDGKVKSVTFLLDHGALANTRSQTSTNETLLHALKASQGSRQIIKILEKHGAKEK